MGEDARARVQLTHKILFEITCAPKLCKDKATQLEKNIGGLFKYGRISSLDQMLCAGIASTQDKVEELKNFINKNKANLPHVFRLLKSQRLLFFLQPDTPLSLLPQLHNDVESMARVGQASRRNGQSTSRDGQSTSSDQFQSRNDG